MTLGLIIDQLGVFLVRIDLAGTGRMLQLGNRIRRPHMLFTTGAESVFAAGIKHGGQHRIVGKRFFMQANGFFGNFKDTNAFNIGRRASEILLDEIFLQANRFENLRTGIRHVGGNAHFGHDLVQPFADRLDVVINILLGCCSITFGQ